MKRHLVNSAYGILDYVSYPLGMLLVAPIVLHKLGAAEYGLWTIATAVVSTGGIIASGFCDANIQRVSRLRRTGEVSSMGRVVRSMLGINLLLGGTLAAIVFVSAPLAARHITASHPGQLHECMVALRIASSLILVRAVESVCVSTQRAFEQYQDSVQINTFVRTFTLGTAAILALTGLGTLSILAATAAFLTLGTYMQFRQARKQLGGLLLWPRFTAEETRALFGFGVFSWMQALGGVIFGQFDRLLLGFTLGTVAVAPYSLCVQFTQPIHGLTASGLQFLFPYLSARVDTLSKPALRRTLAKVFVCNFALVACGSALLLVFGDRLIRMWAGASVAHTAAGILPPIVMGSALMGLSVTGTYAMAALGCFRTLALLSLSTRGGMLLVMTYLVHRHGLQGLATARSFYGLFALLLYFPLMRRLDFGKKISDVIPEIGPCELKEASNS
jgi:O-antigen/teichoic acid export membrane protein